MGAKSPGRVRGIVLWLLFPAGAGLFLFATGTQPGVLGMLLPAWLLIFAAALGADFLRRCARLRELEDILNGLDEKYLFTECAPPAGTHYERQLFALMRRAGRGMIGAVSDARAAQRDYREYVEGWVHQVKAPITAARLVCRRLDGEPRRKLELELAQIQAHVERALFYARAESPERCHRHGALPVQKAVRLSGPGHPADLPGGGRDTGGLYPAGLHRPAAERAAQIGPGPPKIQLFTQRILLEP